MFPAIAPDAIYLGYRHQHNYMFGVYHLKNNKVEPRHEFVQDEDRRIASNVGPWNLDHHLVCHVDRRHILSGACINHRRHTLIKVTIHRHSLRRARKGSNNEDQTKSKKRRADLIRREVRLGPTRKADRKI
ncbi:hypothetical protein EJB05_06933, partial [Eragrostis curvula]